MVLLGGVLAACSGSETAAPANLPTATIEETSEPTATEAVLTPTPTSAPGNPSYPLKLDEYAEL